MIVVATKLDATTDRTRLEKLRDYCAEHGLEFHAISSATGEGIPELVRAMADALDRLAPPNQLRCPGTDSQTRAKPKTSTILAAAHDGADLRRTIERIASAGAQAIPGSRRGAIALFGGTFDPIHLGHLAVARAAERRFHLDQVHFIPSGTSAA